MVSVDMKSILSLSLVSVALISQGCKADINKSVTTTASAEQKTLLKIESFRIALSEGNEKAEPLLSLDAKGNLRYRKNLVGTLSTDGRVLRNNKEIYRFKSDGSLVATDKNMVVAQLSAESVSIDFGSGKRPIVVTVDKNGSVIGTDSGTPKPRKFGTLSPKKASVKIVLAALAIGLVDSMVTRP